LGCGHTVLFGGQMQFPAGADDRRDEDGPEEILEPPDLVLADRGHVVAELPLGVPIDQEVIAGFEFYGSSGFRILLN